MMNLILAGVIAILSIVAVFTFTGILLALIGGGKDDRDLEYIDNLEDIDSPKLAPLLGVVTPKGKDKL